MTTSSSSKAAFTLLANLLFAAAAGCTAFTEDPSTPADTRDANLPPRETGRADGPKAPPVGGPADTSELTNALGIFVSPTGLANADGTREHPVRSVPDAIVMGRRHGKRVYVCAGTYREAVIIADSISVIGGLDCAGGEWRTGGQRSRIESPSSPAIHAKDILSPTRIEGLDVIAPNAVEPSSSSIGLLADHAPGLVVARSKITAGDGANGADGTEGIQLEGTSAATGGGTSAAQECIAGWNCDSARGFWLMPAGGRGGTNVCAGAPGHIAESGGDGGSGGIHEVYYDTSRFQLAFRAFMANAAYQPTAGAARTSAPGADGADGAESPTIGSISALGYAAAPGIQGTNGAPGKGGSGGAGYVPYLSSANRDGAVWRGFGGAGGGAGGCPGLAGTPGKGGGASIGAIVVESVVTLDFVELIAGRGGDAGRGVFGSEARRGGDPGANHYASIPSLAAQPGGRGGLAGISGNGSSGPSIGLAHVGAAPKLAGATTITPGNGGAAIDARFRQSFFGITKTIPATPEGVAKDVLAL